jgi:hypothetical protein
MKSLLGKLGVILIGLAILGYGCPNANAQCAWILWEKSHPNISDKWMMRNGFQTYDQCKKARKDAYETTKKGFLSLKMGYRIIDDTEDLLSMGLSGEGLPSIYYSWMCLPDTVDPRK